MYVHYDSVFPLEPGSYCLSVLSAGFLCRGNVNTHLHCVGGINYSLIV